MERSVFPTDERKVRCGDGEIEHEDKDMTVKELKKLSRADLLSMLLKKTRENEKLQAEIEALDGQIAESATNYGKLNQLMTEKAEKEALLEEKMDRWMYLQELAEKIAAQS